MGGYILVNADIGGLLGLSSCASGCAAETPGRALMHVWVWVHHVCGVFVVGVRRLPLPRPLHRLVRMVVLSGGAGAPLHPNIPGCGTHGSLLTGQPAYALAVVPGCGGCSTALLW